jgi:hypothetical protein
MASQVAAREMIIAFLNSKVGEEVTVEMISSITGINGRIVRRHLRKLRSYYPGYLEFTIQGGRLVYKVIKPIPVGAAVEEEQEELEREERSEAVEKYEVEKKIEAAAEAGSEEKPRRSRGRKKKVEIEVQEELEGIM